MARRQQLWQNNLRGPEPPPKRPPARARTNPQVDDDAEALNAAQTRNVVVARLAEDDGAAAGADDAGARAVLAAIDRRLHAFEATASRFERRFQTLESRLSALSSDVRACTTRLQGPRRAPEPAPPSITAPSAPPSSSAPSSAARLESSAARSER